MAKKYSLLEFTPKVGDALNRAMTMPTPPTNGNVSPVCPRQQLVGGIGSVIAPTETYEGPFALTYDIKKKKVKVNAGYVNRNGGFEAVPSCDLSPKSGEVCVATTLQDNGQWTDTKIEITNPSQFAYPIGRIEVDGDAVEVCSYRVPVAIFIVADLCSDMEQ